MPTWVFLQLERRNALDRKKIARINELAKKAKACGLSVEEKEERELLRREYLQSIRVNFKATLDCIEIIDKK